MDIRKIAIILVIAILFGVLVQATIEAIYPQPRYEDFCKEKFGRPVLTSEKTGTRESCQPYNAPTDEELESCSAQEGYPDYHYDEYSCPTEYSCNFCQKNLNEANKQYNLVVFIVSSIFGLIAIFLGVYLPTEANRLNEWVGTGFMLGGIISVFIGTARYYSDMARIARPIILLIELLIIIWISYKKLNKKLK